MYVGALPEYVQAKIDPEPTSGCWLWTGTTTSGYGEVNLHSTRGRRTRAHRFVYEALVGPIPEGLQLDHLCRNRACVSPWHLEAVTSGENTRRGLLGRTGKERFAARTHCIHGHEMTPENTYRYQRRTGFMTRQCRRCLRAASRRRAA